MNAGDIVYFKRAKKSTHRRAVEEIFKGHAVGVMLGHVPPNRAEPSPDHLFRMMGQIGFVTFDDLAEFIGTEKSAEVIKKFEEKYYGAEAIARIPDSVLEAPKEIQEPSKILDMNGQQVKTEPQEATILVPEGFKK